MECYYKICVITMLVPDIVAVSKSPVWYADVTDVPGALTSGFISP